MRQTGLPLGPVLGNISGTTKSSPSQSAQDRLPAYSHTSGSRHHPHLPHDALVAVIFLELDADLFPRHQLAAPFPGCVTEWLPLLRRVDPCNTNSMLVIVVVEDGDSVTVSNFDDGAFDDTDCKMGGWNEEIEEH